MVTSPQSSRLVSKKESYSCKELFQNSWLNIKMHSNLRASNFSDKMLTGMNRYTLKLTWQFATPTTRLRSSYGTQPFLIFHINCFKACMFTTNFWEILLNSSQELPLSLVKIALKRPKIETVCQMENTVHSSHHTITKECCTPVLHSGPEDVWLAKCIKITQIF